MKNKQYYIDVYYEFIEEDRQYYIKERGDDVGWDSSNIEQEISTPEELVGYYLAWYKEEALGKWLYNLEFKHWLSEDNDREVTRILKELFNE